MSQQAMVAAGARTFGLSHQEEKKLGIQITFYPSFSTISTALIPRPAERILLPEDGLGNSRM
jgi:hypothetical protein